jgi:endogenous inhibitor of DNA gyrase (YacG/DUF329 family)
MTVTKNLRLRCPRCGAPTAWEGNPHRPFCTEKCKLIDLGRWADEEYRVAGEKVDPDTLANVIEFPRKDD